MLPLGELYAYRKSRGDTMVPAVSKFISVHRFSLHRLHFAPLRRRRRKNTPTRPCSVRATQSGVTNTALGHSRYSPTLRWLGQEGITWGRALRFEGGTLIAAWLDLAGGRPREKR